MMMLPIYQSQQSVRFEERLPTDRPAADLFLSLGKQPGVADLLPDLVARMHRSLTDHCAGSISPVGNHVRHGVQWPAASSRPRAVTDARSPGLME